MAAEPRIVTGYEWDEERETWTGLIDGVRPVAIRKSAIDYCVQKEDHVLMFLKNGTIFKLVG